MEDREKDIRNAIQKFNAMISLAGPDVDYLLQLIDHERGKLELAKQVLGFWANETECTNVPTEHQIMRVREFSTKLSQPGIGDGEIPMTHQKAKEILTLAKEASAVTQDWKLDHDNTYIGAQKVPAEHDWYWIAGSMDKPSDGYSAESSDEDMRGPKPIVQTVCRYIAAANPQAITELCERYIQMEANFREMLDDIRQLDGHCPCETWIEADKFLKEGGDDK